MAASGAPPGFVLTRRFGPLSLLCLLWLGAWAASTGRPPRNDLANPGFEQLAGGKLYGWTTPSYWAGAIEPVSDPRLARSGSRCARLTVALKSKKHWGRALASARTKALFGSRLRFAMWAKGRGHFLLGYIQYTPKVPGKPHYKYVWQERATPLAEHWQKVVFDFSLLEPRTLRIAPVAELRGKGAAAYLDDAVLASAADPHVTLRVEPQHPMVPLGGSADVRIQLLEKGRALVSGELNALQMGQSGSPAVTKLAIAKDGCATYRFQARPDTQAGIHAVAFAHPQSGAAQAIYIDVVDRGTADAFERAAKQTKLPAARAHYLFFGDSLTDMSRGRNYVDKVGFWLSKAHGSRATVRNVGVGGDFISRVWQRLNREPNSYRLGMYDGLYKPMPTHVFLFLGHNDSKLSSRSGYADACVPPDRFEREYRLAIQKIQKETNAKVTVMSATSSVYEITQATAEARTAQGKAHNLFGKPEALERFNAIAKKLADECGAAYLDVYQPTRRHPDKPSLFTRDGVHVNNRGNRLLALEILKHLASE